MNIPTFNEFRKNSVTVTDVAAVEEITGMDYENSIEVFSFDGCRAYLDILPDDRLHLQLGRCEYTESQTNAGRLDLVRRLYSWCVSEYTDLGAFLFDWEGGNQFFILDYDKGALTWYSYGNSLHDFDTETMIVKTDIIRDSSGALDNDNTDHDFNPPRWLAQYGG